MQKSNVKTLSIVDTLSELVLDKNAANELTATPVQRPAKSKQTNPSSFTSGSHQSSQRNGTEKWSPSIPPLLKPRSPKVNVPHSSGSPTVVFTSTSTPTKLSHASASTPNMRHAPNANSSSSSSNNNNNHLDLSAITSFHNGMHNSSRMVVVKKKKKKLPSSAVPTSMGVKKESGVIRSQTPEWIREIFMHAKRGLLDKLSQSLDGFEPTLIRNLTEHTGNNLLHAVCAAGHDGLLPWLTRTFGHELNGALIFDENRRGLTPTLLAIKMGHLNCVEWLVRNTCVRDRLASRDGDRQRSLLHYAAKHGKNEIVRWLCEEMVRTDLAVDQIDMAGNSPLHLAAREGQVATLAILLMHGAKVDRKNDMGLRAYDCARLRHHWDCAEFLVLFETSFGVSSKYLKCKAEKEALLSENSEMRNCFKEVLSLAKKLSKERDDMNRELWRMYETMLELHNNMTMEIQVLSQENQSFRKNGTKDSQSSNSSKNIEACTSLHERWQQKHKQWFGSASNDAENKIVIVEENWRKIKSHPQSSPFEESYTQRHLRDLVEEARTELNQAYLPVSSLPMSSEDDMDEGDDEENCDDGEDTVDSYDMEMPPQNSLHREDMNRLKQNIAQRKKLATPPRSSNNNTYANSSGSLEESLYSSLSNDMYSKIGSPEGSTIHHQQTRNQRQKEREELREKLKDFYLATESGSAVVVDIIEPTTSDEEEFESTMKELKWPVPTKPRFQKSSFLKSNASISPTKKLLEMGIVPEEFLDGLVFQNSTHLNRRKKVNASSRSLNNETLLRENNIKNEDKGLNNSKKSPSIFNKFSVWKGGNNSSRNKSKKSAHIVEDESDTEVEEHVLPDNFDEDVIMIKTSSSPSASSSSASSADVKNNRQINKIINDYRKSVSPVTRKAQFVPESVSISTSEDSGIGTQPAGLKPSPSSPRGPSTMTKKPPLSDPQLGKIDEMSVSSSSTLQDDLTHRHYQNTSMNPLNLVHKKSLESKAWYEVPSDDERERIEEEEVDSLASIISTKGASSDDEI